MLNLKHSHVTIYDMIMGSYYTFLVENLTPNLLYNVNGKVYGSLTGKLCIENLCFVTISTAAVFS